ncbi:hypothetical protein PRJ83_002010 [Salmonella enterica]|nr:hypothetical protein [Salmonella enterica]
MSDIFLFSENFEGDVSSNWILSNAEILNDRYGNASHFLTNSHDTHPAGTVMYSATYRKPILYKDLGSLKFKVDVDTITLKDISGLSPVECQILVMDSNGYMISGAADDDLIITPEWSTKTLENFEFIFNPGAEPAYLTFIFNGNLNAIDNINVYNVVD